MSQQYISALIVIVGALLTLFKVQMDQESVTQIVIAAITLISGIWIAYRRYKQGDITVAGIKK